jgi:hypothetical protein
VNERRRGEEKTTLTKRDTRQRERRERRAGVETKREKP